MTLHRSIALLTTLVALAVVLAGCGNDSSSTSSGTSKASENPTFVLDEWSVVPPKDPVRAGNVKITTTNNGKETHELVFVQAADAAALPKNADGSVDEDKIPESKKAGEIEDIKAGTTTTKSLNLPKGDYVAFCNVVEDMGNGNMGSGGMGGGMGGDGMQHVHFKLGMVNYFTVA